MRRAGPLSDGAALVALLLGLAPGVADPAPAAEMKTDGGDTRCSAMWARSRSRTKGTPDRPSAGDLEQRNLRARHGGRGR